MNWASFENNVSSYLCMALLMYTWLLVFMDSDVYVKGFSSFNHWHILAILYFLSLAVLLGSSISCFILVYFSWLGVCNVWGIFLYLYTIVGKRVQYLWYSQYVWAIFSVCLLIAELPGFDWCIRLYTFAWFMFYLVLHWIRLGVRVGCYHCNIFVSLNYYLS